MELSTTPKKRSQSRDLWLILALLAILALGAVFRFYNVNWDKGTYHIHPDERHTTMVVSRLEWPASLGEYLDTSNSPLNPRNQNIVYFYGTLPLFLVKLAAGQVGRTGYDEIHLVGRVLSGLFDLGSVLLLFFLGRRLFDWRVGLISSFLLALTAIHIQGSHYFAVDTFLTFFVLLTIWLTLDVAEGKGWWAYLALGLSMGITLASKVSVFLLALVVVFGVWIWLRQEVSRGRNLGRSALKALAGLALASMVAIVIFRVAQPYAWAGPNYDGWDAVPAPWGEKLRILEVIPEPVRTLILPDPQWIADIVSAGAQQTGEADLPWGRQWTERAPWLWPLENMVLWALGVPLGIAAWLGVGLILVRLVQVWRKRRTPAVDQLPRAGRRLFGARRWDLVLIPLSWVLLTFLWQGMQYVKSVRYFLPIYPFLTMFAAYLVVSAWEWAKGRRWGAKVAAGTLAVIVLVGTLAWAWAFIQIYREPVTRVQATRWMYENIEAGAILTYQSPDGEPGQVQLGLPSTHLYQTNGGWLITPFEAPEDLIATQVVMNNLTGADGPSQGKFEAQLTVPGPGQEVLASAELEATFGGDGGQRHVLDIADTLLSGGEQYELWTRPLSGAPLVSQGAAIANEHFDDPLPFNMDGRIAFGSGAYKGLDLTLYDEDTPEKLEQLLDTLDDADYISMSSGRLWQSIPRLPMRYPVTTRYYELLFAEELGFEKAAEFHSYPRLFGIEFDDTWAEEQFTVYDHPKVLIYKKTDAYDRERVEAMLTEGVEWEDVARWLNPRDVAEWKRLSQQQNDLMLTEAQRQVQEQGGTWASLFNRNSFANGWPTLSWLIMLAILGLASLPLTLALFRWLPDWGYILARPVGVLLLAWLSWILTNLSPLHYSRGTIALSLGLIVLASLVSLASGAQRRRLARFWRRRKGLILVSELLFLAFFGLFWLIRWGNPDLWHAWMGGEKPMDLAYLNAVIKSSEFPPYDPWFAGGYLNYYYFGQVLVGTLIKLIGIMPSVAYNLAIPTWFAMLAMGAFSLTYNLVVKAPAADGKGEGEQPGLSRRSRPYLFALVGALFVAVIGNLGEVYLILLKASQGVMDAFESTIPGLAGLVRATIGSAEVLFGGKALPIAINEWYWNASRAVPSAPYESVITEFPFFTFLYSDLHAHLLALPFAMLSLCVALAVVKRSKPLTGEASGWRTELGSLGLLLVWALAIGALRTTNTWDVPPHLIIVLGALVIAEFSRQGRLNRRLVLSVAWQVALVFVLSWSLLYHPFWANYGSYYDSIQVWTGTRTMLWAYFVVHGLFLFVIVSYLLARVIGDRRQDPLLRRLNLTLRYRGKRQRLAEVARIAKVRGLPVGAWFWAGLVLLVALELFFIVPGLVSFTQADAKLVESGAYAYRGLALYALGLPLALMGLLLLFRRGITVVERLWTFFVLLGLAMSLGVEVVVVEGDIGRMNTVFKFYLQVWLLWAVAAAAGLAWLLPRVRRWGQGRGLWLGILTVLLLLASLYPPLATWAKFNDRFDVDTGPGLDGWAYMERATYGDPNGGAYDLKWDLEAIRWLLDNVVGSPVILEGHAPEYRWGGRYSINTGLPTVLGWNWHQRQQRVAADDQDVWNRVDEISTIYNTLDWDQAESLLEKYNVRYIVVGPLEQSYYEAAGLEKFDQMVWEGRLQRAFSNDQVTIYQVPEFP